MNKYDPKSIEEKWQKIWEETEIYKTPAKPGQDKAYTLVMFPYTSGDLHSGHWYNFGPGDTVARFFRMQGKNVLHPMGFDAFGLPAENAAIKRGIDPNTWTKDGIKKMTEQLKKIGTMYDWDKVVNTSDPDYYRWTQWLFLLFYKHGIAYRAKGWQNWCPKDQTVLANEQVIGENNVCERCGTPVIKKELEQWFFKITDYAERLLNDIDKLEWPQRVKTMQRNWIGKSEGSSIKFSVEGSDKEIEVFTTRPDTLFGATYMVMAPEHPLVEKLVSKDQSAEVKKYQEETGRKTELDRMEEGKDKSGVFTGAHAVNPINGEKIPIWVADYVLMGYGTGAIMAVPAHDQRDNDFAKKFKLPVQNVVNPVLVRDDAKGMTEFKSKKKIVAVVENDKGEILTINWGPKLGGRLTIGGTIEGDESPQATALREVEEETGYHDLEVVEVGAETMRYKYYAFSKNEAHDAAVNFVHLRVKGQTQKPQKLDESEHGNFKVEWVDQETAEKEIVEPLHRYGYDKFIHGRVYTGEGPLVHSGKYAELSGDEAKHAIIEDLHKEGRAEAATKYRLRDWLISRQRYWGAPIPIVYCDDCGIVPVPEEHLPVKLPTDVEFEPTGQSPLATRPDFYETDCPKCGKQGRRETDTMDTFVDSSWYFLRYPNTKIDDKAFDTTAVRQWLPVDQYIGGIEHAILHLLYARFFTKVLFDQKLIGFDEPFTKLYNQGIIVGPDGQKMSKSRGNVVNPDDYVSRYGADTFRMYLMFMGPYDQGGPFDPKGINGVFRFLQRCFNLVEEFSQQKSAGAGGGSLATSINSTIQKMIKRVAHDTKEFQFNTAIAAMMEGLNELFRLKADLPISEDTEGWRSAIEALIKLLAPYAPHAAEEMWQIIGETESIHLQGWPKYDESLVKEELIEIPVQVNGKLRSTVTAPPDSSEAELVALAKEQTGVQKQLEGKEIARTVYVPRRLINFVTK